MLPKDARVGTLDHSVLQEAVLAEASKPSEKRRGSWSFLTWSFFLAQTIAAEKFFGSGARAGENDDAGATRSNDQSKIPSDETAAAAAWGPGGQDAGDGRIDAQTPLTGAQGLALPGVSQAASDNFGAGSFNRLAKCERERQFRRRRRLVIGLGPVTIASRRWRWRLSDDSSRLRDPCGRPRRHHPAPGRHRCRHRYRARSRY
jgi:hypothetical protein